MRSLMVLVFLFLSACQEEPKKMTAASAPPSSCDIIRVVDGDTVKAICHGREQNLRLLGFDTPETFRSRCPDEKALGKIATNHLRKLIENAREVLPVTGRPDKYRRLLTRLYIDGRDVAEIMIEAGLAVPYHGEKRINWCDRLVGRKQVPLG
ncbi:thermonuclease family protein [Aliiroseovarius crassostreae]|uniref:Thermonuclease family protein n=1 Tax=Aliiroseovarius crassostreae TaxID=154981 RepID=A0A9Q9M0A7_9RHOB|nr:thermonuclease family protein [Aliiroseovarius crassostreae]UWP96394.1 thermonuclease family protein [Aliiroseovarius crassostreae]UWP99557.1 thermonuclease family protein [Aliiroseovarius crassostreae]